MPSHSRVVHYPSTKKLLLSILSGLVLTTLCLWIVLDPVGRPSLVVGAGWFGVPFFSAGTAFFAYRLLGRRPSVVLTDEGIYDNASLVAAGFIPWSEISRVDVLGPSAAMITLGLKSNAAVFARLSPLHRLYARCTAALGFRIVAIPGAMVSVTPEVLAGQITHFLGEHEL